MAFKSIRLRDFRHYRSSKEYHWIKDLLYVKSFLGNSDLRRALKYIQLVDFGEDGYSFKVAKNVVEAADLIEAGFQFVCDVAGVKLFKKAKWNLLN